MTQSAIPGVETFVLDPPGLGVELRISIALPPRSGTGHPSDGPLAVAYVTDGDFCFGTAAEQARMMQFAGEVAPVAVVGIGYAAETGDYAFVGKRRGTDFYSGPRRTITLPGLGAVELGGADGFLAALRDHVFPAVDARVPRIDPARRFLLGTSAGGHFVAYAITRAPKEFAGYALMSPNLRDFPPVAGEEVLIRAVQAMPKGSLPAGVRVFLSAGAGEEDPGHPLAAAAIITNLYRMQAALAAHGAITERAIFPGETHTSVPGAAISRALRFLLPGTAPSVWQQVLEAATWST